MYSSEPINQTNILDSTLCSFQKVEQSIPSAANSSIEAYRSWLKERRPISQLEIRFLDQSGDLVTLARRSFGFNIDTSSAHFVIAVAASAVVLPLLAFSAVPQFVGRIIVLGVIGAAVTVFLGSSKVAGLLSPEEVWKCGAV